jgi:ribonuclease P protein component
VKRKFRLTNSTDFKRVRRFGKSYAHPLIVLVVQPGESAHSRFGIAASRNIGNAVKRNRAKRRLRAALQPYLADIMPGWDAILIARQPIVDVEFVVLQDAIFNLLMRAGLLCEVHDAGNNQPST